MNMKQISLVIILSVYLPFHSFSQGDFTIEPLVSEGCMQSSSEAVFTDLVRTDFDGSKVEKTNGYSSWNGGAFSTAGIVENGSVETTITQTNKTRIFGLSHSNDPDQNGLNTVEYAIVLNSWGYAEIRESGNYKEFLWFFDIGDKFKIAVSGGVVQYYKNDNLVYQSNQAASLPLYVDLAFEDIGSEISNVQISNNSGTTIRAFGDEIPSNISSFNWYQNNQLLPETSAEITLSSFADGDIIKCTATPSSGENAGVLQGSNTMVLHLDENALDLDHQISALPVDQGCFLAVENVLWRTNNPENMEISEGNVTKINGYNTSNGGVYSQNTVANNGYFEFQTGGFYSSKMVGLSATDGGSSEGSIQFAFYVEWAGAVRIYENGNRKATVGYINTNDKLRIHIDNGIVKYYVNDELEYVSEQTPNTPLIVDGTIEDDGASITNATITNPTSGEFSVISDSEIDELIWKINGQTIDQTGTTISIDALSENDIISSSYISSQIGCGNILVESNTIEILINESSNIPLFFIEGVYETSEVAIAVEQVVWNLESLANVSNIDNNLTKTEGNNQFNAGASSLNTVKNNGYFDFTVSENNKQKIIGLSYTDPNFNYNSVDYAMLLGRDGEFDIYESGNRRLRNRDFEVGDVLRIAVEDNTVKYYHNQILVYTSNVEPNLPLLVDVSLRNEGGTVQNAEIGNMNEKRFKAQYTGLGLAPIFEWYVNGITTGMNGDTFNYDDIENNDIITCTVIPNFAGCSINTEFQSNYIRFNGTPNLTDWLGGMNTQWNNSINWSAGIPNANLSAKIPAGRPHKPVINSDQSVKNILVEENAELKMTGGGTLKVYGDFSILGEFNAGNGTISFNGDGNRKINGNELIFKSLVINLSQSDNEIELLSDISISEETIFVNGKVNAHNFELIYLNGSETQEGNSDSFIDGVVRKVGNSSFTFPTGAGNIYAPVSISAPQNATDEFTAQYFHNDPSLAGFLTSLQDGSLGSISSCEYWTVDRSKGTSMVHVTLSYDIFRSCGILDLSFLQVTHWNGQEWENMGMDFADFDLVDVLTGKCKITSQDPINNFSPFTTGSVSETNTLPIELHSFSAEKQSGSTNLEWVTDTETNNSFFTLERSDDAIKFNEITTVPGAGSSRQRLSYQFVDYTPKSGINYYRLSQTDYDGKNTFFDIKSVYFESNDNIVVYPNPNEGIFTIVRTNENPVHMRLFDVTGKTHWINDTDEMLTQVTVYKLPKGIYFLNIDDGQHQTTEKVIIN